MSKFWIGVFWEVFMVLFIILYGFTNNTNWIVLAFFTGFQMVDTRLSILSDDIKREKRQNKIRKELIVRLEDLKRTNEEQNNA